MEQSDYDGHVSAFLNGGVITLSANAKAEDGRWYLQEPFVSIAVEEGASGIGELLRDELRRRHGHVSTEELTEAHLRDVFSRLLAAIGVASVDELIESAKHCGVGEIDGRIELTPTRVSPGEMFTFVEENQIIVASEDTGVALGLALMDCFGDCESAPS